MRIKYLCLRCSACGDPYEVDTQGSPGSGRAITEEMEMALKLDEMKASATSQFEKLVLEKFEFMCNHVYASNIKHYLDEVNELIRAARKLHVTESSTFGDDEIKTAVDDLAALRTLKMNDETRAYLTPLFELHGLDSIIAQPKK